MEYNIKRALSLALGLYVSTFVVALICGLVSGQDMSSMSTPPDYFWYLGMAGAVILTSLFTVWYFKSPSLVPSSKSGFWFGLTAAALSFVLDYVIFTVGNMGMEEKTDLGNYFGDYRYWIIVVLVILSAKSVGYMKSRKTTQI